MSKISSKKIQYGWSLLCSGVSIDQDTNNLTLFNIIDQVKVSEDKLFKMPTKNGEDKPAAPIGFNLITLWRKLDGTAAIKGDVQVELLDPQNIVRQKGNYSVELPEGIERSRSRMQWNGIRVTTSGKYTFRISLKEDNEEKFKKVGEAYLVVEILPSQKKEEGESSD